MSQLHPSRWRAALRRAIALVVALTLGTLASTSRAAPAIPYGPAVAVSSEDGYFRNPAAAVDSAGTLVVVWQGDTAAQPGSEIYGRRFASNGAPLGPAFRVNSDTAGEQRRPVVGVAADGSFVVAWDTDTRSVWARRFGPDGAPRGGDIAVSQSAALHRDPAIAVAPDGAFAVAWELAQAGDGDIALRRFAADGAPLAGEQNLQIGAAEAALQINPAVAALPAGRLAVAWEQTELTSLVPASELWLQPLDAAGSLTGAALSVASASGVELRDPALSVNASGALMVAWAAFSVGDGAVYVRAYDQNAQPLGPATPVSPAAQAERSAPALALSADGTAAAAWLEATQDGDAPAQVVARPLTATGTPAGAPSEPRATVQTALPASTPLLAIGPATGGPLWVAWSQTPPDQQTGGSSAIYARRLVDTITQVNLPLVRR